MNLSAFDIAMWVATFVGDLAVLFVLLRRARWREFPIFTAWIAFNAVLSIVLFAVYRLGSARLYLWVYSSLTLIDLALQLGIVFEMARNVLRPTGTWVRDARSTFLIAGGIGAVVAAGLAFAVSPPAPTSLFALLIKVNLFNSMLLCELVLAMMLSAHRLGLQWRNHVMGLGQGLIAWAVISLLVETLHSYWGWTRDYVALDHISIFAYIAALGYWMVTFWRAEPERRELSLEMRNYLVALHKRVEYDLGNIGS